MLTGAPAAAQELFDLGTLILGGGLTPVEQNLCGRSFSVITAEDIEERGITTVEDALYLSRGASPGLGARRCPGFVPDRWTWARNIGDVGGQFRQCRSGPRCPSHDQPSGPVPRPSTGRADRIFNSYSGAIGGVRIGGKFSCGCPIPQPLCRAYKVRVCADRADQLDSHGQPVCGL